MIGVTLAGLAEGMALADRAGLQQKDVLEVKWLDFSPIYTGCLTKIFSKDF